jgi:hypothetical protein
MAWDIIPDIHGQAAKLSALLDRLGWQRRNAGWTHSENDRRIVFLGDFIDRGPENEVVIKPVRSLVDSGRAVAIMGNHELNAIHYHRRDPETGVPLRRHTPSNAAQHETFLREMPLGSKKADEAISWFSTLPLWLDIGPFRVVHAHWSDAAIDLLSASAIDGRLDEQNLIRAGRKSDPVYEAAGLLTKGPELELPEGHEIRDGHGHPRRDVRIAWWRTAKKSTWQELAVSVPNPSELPNGQVQQIDHFRYPPGAKPVVFGHYWLSGAPVLEASNAMCLDYSAGRGGSLIAYQWYAEDKRLSLDRVVSDA